MLGSEARAIVQTVLAFAWRGLRGLPQIPVLAWRHIVYMTEPARSKATLVVVLIWRAIESGVTFLTRTLSGADEAAEGAGARLAALLDWAVSAVAGVLRWALDMGRWHAVWSAIVRWALSSLSGVWAVLREIGRSIAEAVARVLSEAVNIPDWIAFLAKYLRELWDARDMRGAWEDREDAAPLFLRCRSFLCRCRESRLPALLVLLPLLPAAADAGGVQSLSFA